MKFVYYYIDRVFDTSEGRVNSLVIENQSLFLSLIQDIENQLRGLDGVSVLSEKEKIVPIEKRLELLAQFVPFELNRKPILNKITAELERTAVSGEFFQKAAELSSSLESFLAEISFELPIDVDFKKVDILSIIKASGIEIKDTYEKLGEKLIDYFELVTEFLGKKLFVTVNLRSYLSDEETEEFMKTVLSHEFEVLMIENREFSLLPFENRHIVDSDLCEIHR